mmetsp:Transcript_103411/g.297036  ORF Transcript_103411/g.297036 Transcript_103411/m.297036 type:complete len:425 (+) Transcript_103411:217-1491(+)
MHQHTVPAVEVHAHRAPARGGRDVCAVGVALGPQVDLRRSRGRTVHDIILQLEVAASDVEKHGNRMPCHCSRICPRVRRLEQLHRASGREELSPAGARLAGAPFVELTDVGCVAGPAEERLPLPADPVLQRRVGAVAHAPGPLEVAGRRFVGARRLRLREEGGAAEAARGAGLGPELQGDGLLRGLVVVEGEHRAVRELFAAGDGREASAKVVPSDAAKKQQHILVHRTHGSVDPIVCRLQIGVVSVVRVRVRCHDERVVVQVTREGLVDELQAQHRRLAAEACGDLRPHRGPGVGDAVDVGPKGLVGVGRLLRHLVPARAFVVNFAGMASGQSWAARQSRLGVEVNPFVEVREGRREGFAIEDPIFDLVDPLAPRVRDRPDGEALPAIVFRQAVLVHVQDRVHATCSRQLHDAFDFVQVCVIV